MRKAIAATLVAALALGFVGAAPRAEAGDHEWAVAGKILAGLVVLDALTTPRCAPTVVYEPAVVYQPSPVYYPPAVVYPPVVYRQPVVVPAPVYYPPARPYYGASFHFTSHWRPQPYHRGSHWSPPVSRWHGGRRW